MYSSPFVSLIASITLASSTVHGMSTSTGTSVTSTVTSSVSGSHSTAEGTVSGKNAQIVIDGDHVEIQQGKLTLNGIPYGTVGEHSVVTYRVNGNIKQLLVDGVEREPER